MAHSDMMNRYIEKLVEKYQLDKEVLISYWKELQPSEPEKHICQSKVKTGDAAGQVCGRELVNGLCPIHKPRGKRVPKGSEPPPSTDSSGQPDEEEVVLTNTQVCKYVFTKGKNNGTTCDKKCSTGSEWCKNHSKPVVEKSDKSSVSSVEATEPEVMEIRCQRKGNHIVLKGTMVALSDDVETCLGYLEPQEDGEFLLIEKYTQEVENVCTMYNMKCNLQKDGM